VSERRLTRRSFLARGAVAGLGPSGPLARAALAATAAKAGDRPFPALPAGTESMPQIKHIVVLMMENHSFDNHFGTLARSGVDGLRASDRNPDGNGGYVYVTQAPSTCQAGYTISQSWDASHQSWDHGRNDGFVEACGADACTTTRPASCRTTTRSRRRSRCATATSRR
jgi:phospholipase C